MLPEIAGLVSTLSPPFISGLIYIVSFSGLGKTALCKFIAKYMFVRKRFDSFIWVDLSKLESLSREKQVYVLIVSYYSSPEDYLISGHWWCRSQWID